MYRIAALVFMDNLFRLYLKMCLKGETFIFKEVAFACLLAHSKRFIIKPVC